MAKEQRSFSTSRGVGPHASRRGLLQAGLAIGTLALGRRAALGQSGGAHAHMPEVGVATLPVVPAMDQPLVEPEVRRSANGVLSTSLRCAYAYRDIGGMRLYLRAYEGGLGPTLRMKPGETLKIATTPQTAISSSNPSRPHQFNNTNLHFHGAHCSPSASRKQRAARRPVRAARMVRGHIRITTARPMCRWRAARRAPSSSKAISPMCRRSPGRASASCCCRRRGAAPGLRKITHRKKGDSPCRAIGTGCPSRFKILRPAFIRS